MVTTYDSENGHIEILMVRDLELENFICGIFCFDYQNDYQNLGKRVFHSVKRNRQVYPKTGLFSFLNINLILE